MFFKCFLKSLNWWKVLYTVTAFICMIYLGKMACIHLLESDYTGAFLCGFSSLTSLCGVIIRAFEDTKEAKILMETEQVLILGGEGKG